MSNVPVRQHPVNEPGPDPGPESSLNSGPRTPAGDAFSGLVVRLFRLNGLIAAEGETLARPAGQSTARWQVLASVEGAPATVATIARTLGLARQSVQRVADALEGGDLISFQDNPRHRRARLVTLTGAGREALSRIQAEQRPWANALGAAVGERELLKATSALDRVLAVMTERRSR
jgi:DNA-binding MarR family transcriptional regulator